MKILIISAVFPPEPVVSAKLSYDIALRLSERNLVTVVSPRPSRPLNFQFSSFVKNLDFMHIYAKSFVHPTSGIVGRFMESYSFGRFCHRYIVDNHNNIDIIYANTWPLLAQYFVVKAARRYGIPITLHVQDIYPESLIKKIPVGRFLLRFILKPMDKYDLVNSGRVIAISKKMKDYLANSRNLDTKKISMVPNWQDEGHFLEFAKQVVPSNGKPFTFMFLGNIGPVAGVDLLLNAFINSKLKECRLVIAGSGSMKEKLLHQAQAYPGFMIEFWDVPEGKVPELQAKADILMLPVKKGNGYTSIPSKLSAYMFSGRPIIACVDSDSDTADAIKEANCGFVIEPENVESLVNAMKQVFNMGEQELENLGRNGREYALLNFSKKANLSRIVSLIENSA